MKKVLAILLTLCLVLPLLTVSTVSAAGFTDLSGHWARNYVMPLHQKGIISGKSETIFDPEASVTRAEFLTLALKVPHIRALKFEKTFDDVLEEQWFSKTFTEAAKRDIIPAEMLNGNNVAPDQPITREEMTAVLVRLWEGLRGNIKAGQKDFTDSAAISEWTKESVQKAVALGVITGNADGSFNPLGLATRAEMAVMFKRLYDKCQTPIEKTAAGEYSPVYKGIIREDVDINKMINDAYNSGASEVVLPEGVFRVPSLARGHIDLSNMRNFTVKGNNTTLLFQRRTTFGFYCANGYNLKVENLTVDYEIPAYAQGEIIGFDPDGFYFDLWIDPAYPCAFNANEELAGDFFTAEGLLCTESRSTAFSGKLLEKLGDNKWRINSPTLVNIAKGVNVGDYYVFRSNDSSANTFYIQETDGFSATDVTIYGGKVGFSVGYGDETNKSVYERVKIIPGPAPLGGVIPRLTSVSGTGLQFTCMRTGFSIIDSIIVANGDDGTNIQGVYNRAGEKLSKNTYTIAAGNISQQFLPGDVFRFYTEEYAFLDEATIVSAEPIHNYTSPVDVVKDVGVWTFSSRQWYKVVLDKEPVVEFPGWVVNASENCNGFEIKNTSFTNGRARGILVKADGTIDGCFVDRRPIGIMIAPELYWLEADYIRKVEVKNTTVSNCGFGAIGSAPFGVTVHASTYNGQTPCKSIDQGEVLFENCVFDNNFGVQMELRESKNVTVRNCTFKDSGNSSGHIVAGHMGTLTLEGNTFEGNLEALQQKDGIGKLNQ